MSTDPQPFVFDAGPLSHFSQAGWLGLLREAVDGAEAWIPSAVLLEISDGVNTHAHLRSVLDAGWLTVRAATTTPEIAALGKYTARMLGDDQRENLGECEVLALAEVSGGIAVIDDGVARGVAAEFNVEHKTTVALLCDLVRARHLSLDMASAIADRLLQTAYRLPFEEGGFRRFVLENDYLPYD